MIFKAKKQLSELQLLPFRFICSTGKINLWRTKLTLLRKKRSLSMLKLSLIYSTWIVGKLHVIRICHIGLRITSNKTLEIKLVLIIVKQFKQATSHRNQAKISRSHNHLLYNKQSSLWATRWANKISSICLYWLRCFLNTTQNQLRN